MIVPNGLILASWVLALSASLPAQNTTAPASSINQDSQIIQRFTKKVDDYLKLRKRAHAGLRLPKSGSSAATSKTFQQIMAHKIRTARRQAKAGDIFDPPSAQLFRKLIAEPLRGSDGDKIRASLRRAEPVSGLNLRVNQAYPQSSALQSTPPTLLMNLPKLPAELEYRIVGRDLVLLDTTANLVVDLLHDALPASPSEP